MPSADDFINKMNAYDKKNQDSDVLTDITKRITVQLSQDFEKMIRNAHVGAEFHLLNYVSLRIAIVSIFCASEITYIAHVLSKEDLLKKSKEAFCREANKKILEDMLIFLKGEIDNDKSNIECNKERMV